MKHVMLLMATWHHDPTHPFCPPNTQAIAVGTYGTFLVLLVPLAVGYGYILKYVRHTSIEVQRLEANARSPVSVEPRLLKMRRHVCVRAFV
jgi:hypothetical protein